MSVLDRKRGASPQIENGYTRIAHELLDEIAATKMNDSAKGVVLYVARRSYGNGEKFAVIDPGKLAEKLKVSAQYARRLIRLLTTALILKEGVPPERQLSRGERYLGISKDYTLWQWRSAFAHERAAERQRSLIDLGCGKPVDDDISRAPRARENCEQVREQVRGSRARGAREEIASPNRSVLVASQESSSSSSLSSTSTTTRDDAARAVAEILATIRNPDETPGLTTTEIAKHARRFLAFFDDPVAVARNYAQAVAQGGVRTLDSWIGSNLERRIERPAVKRDTLRTGSRAARNEAETASVDWDALEKRSHAT